MSKKIVYLRPSDWIKVYIPCEEVEGFGGENLWTQVIAVSTVDGRLQVTAEVDQEPVLATHLKPGAVITYGVNQIIKHLTDEQMEDFVESLKGLTNE